MTDDIVKRLRIKAGVMEMGERIAWGSDTALMREAAHVIEALRKSQTVPKGWKLVPQEPTEAMIDNGYYAYGPGHYTPAILDCYKAMLDAAPKPKETRND